MGGPVLSDTPIPWDACADEDAWWQAEIRRRVQRRAELRHPDPEVRAQLVALDRHQCSRDFLFWAESYAWMYDPGQANPARRQVPFVAWPRQREFVHWLDERTARGEVALVPKDTSARAPRR